MVKFKIKWSSSVVIDILLIYFAFLLTYFTCKQLNPDVLASFGQVSFLSRITSNALLLLFSIATLVTLVRIGTFLCFRIYKPIWRYAGVKEFCTFATAIGISSLLLMGISGILKNFDTWPFFLIDGIYSAIIIGFIKFSHSILRVSHIREVKLEDLLNRSTDPVDLAEISKYLSGKRVMVTGAGGSIGSELCRQVAKLDPELLILFGRGENSIYHIDMELRESDPQLNRELIIGDIRDNSKVFQITKRYRPHIIFHAAAHKHVKFMERHPDEAVKNNILGTKNLIDAAIKNQVEAFILVSSDKSVNPTSVYGASKRVTEKLIQCKANRNGTKFIAVRFGNVIGSRASVLPNFKRQIAKGGPVTVTHREATRYFMTIPEAVQLLIQAGAMGNGGEILMLDMGEPIKILDLARDLIRLSGLELDKDIKIDFTGLEAGEKLYEELLTPQEGVTATKHQRIFVAQMEHIEEEQLLSHIDELSEYADALDTDGIIAKFQKLVPTYKPNREFIKDTVSEDSSQTEIRRHLIKTDKDTEVEESGVTDTA